MVLVFQKMKTVLSLHIFSMFVACVNHFAAAFSLNTFVFLRIIKKLSCFEELLDYDCGYMFPKLSNTSLVQKV